MMLKLISANIEWDKHLEHRVLPFLKEEEPDVICLQEVFRGDFESMQALFEMDGVFAPNAYSSRRDDEWGVALLTRHNITGSAVDNYRLHEEGNIPPENLVNPDIHHRSVVSVEILVGSRPLRVATTQFTWTPDGTADDRQREDVEKLIKILKERKSEVMTGDFNAPRGEEIFSRLTSVYRDNIPAEYKTSLDKHLHRIGDLNLNLMVDGLFSTENVRFGTVRLVDGVSDHVAVVAEIAGW